MSAELRYHYTGSYRDPKRYHFGSGDWLSEADCRTTLAANLRSAEVAGESLHVIVQHKKSRWLPLKNGSVAEIFPDLVCDFEREKAIADVIDNEALPTSVRRDAAYAVKCNRIEEALARAELLVTTLRQVIAARSLSDADLMARWVSRCTAAPLP